MGEKIRIGISACLLGRSIRFDGGHKHDRYLTDTLGRYVEWVPLCPEVEMGMSIPREPMRVVQLGAERRVLGTRSHEDFTDRLRAHAARRMPGLEGLDGMCFKKGSPSCGLYRVRVYPDPESGLTRPMLDGIGVFARAFREAYPLVPVEEEGRLNDAGLRENFAERIWAWRRLRTLLEGDFTHAELMAFHAAHKYQLLAHSTEGYRGLGRLVAAGGMEALRGTYPEGFMAALAVKATPERHVNVLQHILGHFRPHLSAEDRQEVLALIDEYRRGIVSRLVPLALLQHYLRAHGDPWLEKQTYFAPHPRELMVRPDGG